LPICTRQAQKGETLADWVRRMVSGGDAADCVRFLGVECIAIGAPPRVLVADQLRHSKQGLRVPLRVSEKLGVRMRRRHTAK